MTTGLNFNKLAWDAPKHGEEYGYMPNDQYYNEICDWLSSGITFYEAKYRNCTMVGKRFKESAYKVIVTYVHATKMISWVFRID